MRAVCRCSPDLPVPGSVLFCDSNYGYETLQFNAENTVESRGEDWENFLTFGYQFSEQTRTATDITGTYADVTFHPEGEDTKHGFYVQNEFIWNEQLTIIPGIRVDSRTLSYAGTDATVTQSNVSDTAVSPKVAAHYKFNDNFAVFGSLAHTERLPTIDEAFSTQGNGPTFLPSPDLKKEQSDNWEAGFALSGDDLLEEGDSGQLKLTYFDNTIEDLIDNNPAASPTTPGYINVDNAHIYGVEVEAAYDAELWYAKAAYTWSVGKNSDTGQHLDSVAPEEIAFTLGARVPEHNLDFGWKARFVSDPAADCRVNCFGATGTSRRYASAFDVHDVYLTWKPEDGEYAGWEARLGVDNIFDTQYKEFLGNDDAKGRTFKITLAKSIGW